MRNSQPGFDFSEGHGERMRLMKEIRAKELTLENFEKYGTFKQMLTPQGDAIGEDPILFFRDMAQQKLGMDHMASFSICQVKPRDSVIDVTEHHSGCGEACLALDGDVVFHVAKATPDGQIPLDDFEAFYAPKGTLVIINPGVWHHACHTLENKPVNTLIVLPERAYANDCVVYELKDEEKMKIVL